MDLFYSSDLVENTTKAENNMKMKGNDITNMCGLENIL